MFEVFVTTGFKFRDSGRILLSVALAGFAAAFLHMSDSAVT